MFTQYASRSLPRILCYLKKGNKNEEINCKKKKTPTVGQTAFSEFTLVVRLAQRVEVILAIVTQASEIPRNSA